MQYKITLNSTSPSETIYLNDEKPYFELVKLKVVTGVVDSAAIDKYSTIVFKYNKKVKPGYRNYAENVEYSHPLSTLVDFNNNYFESSLNKIINTAEDYNYSEVELALENACPETELEVWYEMEKLYPFQNASQAFKQHLENNGNIKILFSGPFGTGKTTFLREYFSMNASYEVFHLFPVNYSVATNEDIFRYLKAELLFLLLEKGVEFDKQSLKKTETVPAFLKDNALNILLPFTRLIPQVGKSVHDILEELINLKNLFESYHEDIQIDDERKAKKFIKELYEQEGSVFEDNFYTQIIRQLLEKIKQKENKPCL